MVAVSGRLKLLRRLAFTAAATVIVGASCTQAEPTVDEKTTTTLLVVASPSVQSASTVAPVTKPHGGSLVAVESADRVDLEEVEDNLAAIAHLSDGRRGWHVRRWAGERWVPGLLAQIPSVENGQVRLNDDGSMTVRYEIHPDAVWEDGTAITGADFAFTYEFVMANFDALVELGAELGGTPTWIDLFPQIGPESFVVVANSFEYRAPVATRSWVDLFDVVIPKHQVQTTDLAPWLEHSWQSAGPWLNEFNTPFAEGDSGFPETVRSRNDQYWVTDPVTEQRLPFLDEVRTVYVPRSEAWDYFLATDEADLMTHVVTTETIDDIVAMDLIVNPLGATFEHIGFAFGPSRLDANSDSLVAHLMFRQAIAHALDRDRIAQEVYGGQIDAIDSYVTVFSPSASGDAWSQFDYDPARSRDLLGGLCAELERDCELQPLTLTYSTTDLFWRPPTAELVREMLAEVGIEVTVDADHANLGDIAAYEAIQFAWFLGQPGLESLVDIHKVFAPDSPSNPYSWGTEDSTTQNVAAARFAEIQAAMATTLDDDQLRQLIREAEQILADELVIIPLFPQGWADIWKPDRVSGPEVAVNATRYDGTLESRYRIDVDG